MRMALLRNLLATIACLVAPCAGQEPPLPPDPIDVPDDVVETPAGVDASGDEDEDDGDDLDSLLDLADDDLGRLSQVRVAQPTASAPAAAAEASPMAPSLNTAVSTVERKESTVGKTPAAVFVISNEMIRRSGARSIPEVLRMAPGVQVARIDGNKWAVSMRGFNSRFSNQLLVQIDGRSVYNPLFGGVLWDAQGTLLEDVERIEVVRGPGGTVWGANAVNGVINIVTKNAKDTVGTFFEAGGGSLQRSFSSFRHGWQTEPNTHMRVHGQWADRDALRSPTDHDDSRAVRFGARLDWTAADDSYTLQGDYYSGASGTRAVSAAAAPFLATINQFDERISGGNVLFRHVHKESETENSQFQAYYDLTQRSFVGPGFYYERHTVDLDYQHRWEPLQDHDVLFGAGYRAYWDRVDDQPFFLSLTPQRDHYDIVSGFLQDRMTLLDDLLYFTIGTKISHNDFTGTEIQPSARLLWTPSEDFSVWASASRAVRTATRLTRDSRVVLPGGASPFGPVFPVVNGNRGIEAEDVFALEFGFREQPVDWFSYDIAMFSNRYRDLVGLSAPAGLGIGPEGLIAPILFTNTGSATAWGAELATNLEMNDDWSLRAAYTFLKVDFDGAVLGSAGDSPQNQFYLQSSHNLGAKAELDLIWRYVDHLPGQNVKAYSAFDARLGWHPTEQLEVFAVGQNLFDAGHFEFGDDTFAGAQATQVPRGVYAGLSIRF